MACQKLNVHLLPGLTTPQNLAGGTVVVIDVLRATTTIVHALAAGAREIIPCLEVKEARDLARQRPGQAVLGGERQGLQIDGFDLGNSPWEYTSEAVANKTIVFTTTNGTRAMMLCTGADRVLIGAFVNVSAVCRALTKESSIHLLCAGTRNEITREDALLAGAIVDQLLTRVDAPMERNDQAEIVVAAWRSHASPGIAPSRLARVMRDTQGGRNLIRVGCDQDLEAAAAIDKFDIVPELNRSDWAIRLT